MPSSHKTVSVLLGRSAIHLSAALGVGHGWWSGYAQLDISVPVRSSLGSRSVLPRSFSGPPSVLIRSSLSPPSVLPRSSFASPSVLIRSSLGPPSILTRSSLNPHSILPRSSFAPSSLLLRSSPSLRIITIYKEYSLSGLCLTIRFQMWFTAAYFLLPLFPCRLNTILILWICILPLSAQEAISRSIFFLWTFLSPQFTKIVTFHIKCTYL